MIPIPAILEKIIETLDVSKNEFATELGFKRSDNLYKILRGEVGPTWATLARLAERYPNISAEYILRGEGTVFKPSSSVTDSQIGNNNSYQKNIANGSQKGTGAGQHSNTERDILLSEKDRLISVLQTENEFLKTLIPKPPHQ